MTTPPEPTPEASALPIVSIPPEMADQAGMIISASSFAADSLMMNRFAGFLEGQPHGAINQELILAQLMATIRLLVSKNVFTSVEFTDAVQAWFVERKEWAEQVVNHNVVRYNTDFGASYEPIDIDNPTSPLTNYVGQFTEWPVWPWMHTPVEPAPEPPVE